MSEKKTYDNNNPNFITILYPILRRIFVECDINFNDVEIQYKEINYDFVINNIDAEIEFVHSFVSDYIIKFNKLI